MATRSQVTKGVIGAIIGVGALASFAAANGGNTATSSAAYCDEVDISYEERSEHTQLIPSGEEAVVQSGKEGTEKVCYDSEDVEISREVTEHPVEEVTVMGDGDLPLDAEVEFSDSDYADNWSSSGGKITRNFTQEARIAYYGRLREEAEVEYSERVGAICRDGSRSYATGRGACSHHSGVREWLYE